MSDNSLRFGFLTGMLTKIGSGQGIALPLAQALDSLGWQTFGIELTRWRRGLLPVDGLKVRRQPAYPAFLRRPLLSAKTLWRRLSYSRLAEYPLDKGRLDFYDATMGKIALDVAGELNLDILYVFHNLNAARVLQNWSHPARLLLINLIGFGIDPSRGGATDTFPLQELIFRRPFWDLQIAATHFEYRQYLEIYDRLGIDRHALIFLPHPFDQELFQPSPVTKPSKDTLQMLYPVNVYPRKNVEFALEVLCLLDEVEKVELIVTGRIWDADYHARLLDLAKELGVANRIKFLGGVSRQELIALYRQADVTIFPSHQETFGQGLVESLGCGTPVVGPEWLIPCREILSHSAGGWLAPKDPALFADVVLEALKAKDSPEQIATGARSQFGNVAIARQLIEAVLAKRAGKLQRWCDLQAVDWKGLYQDEGDLL